MTPPSSPGVPRSVVPEWDDTRGRVVEALATAQSLADAATEPTSPGGWHAKIGATWEICSGKAITDTSEDIASWIFRATDARFIAAARTGWPASVAALQKVMELHQPEKRWHDGTREWSFDTAEGAAYYCDGDLGDMEYFEICEHCLELDARDAQDYDEDYRGSLWPCPTVAAVASVLVPQEGSSE